MATPPQRDGHQMLSNSLRCLDLKRNSFLCIVLFILILLFDGSACSKPVLFWNLSFFDVLYGVLVFDVKTVLFGVIVWHYYLALFKFT